MATEAAAQAVATGTRDLDFFRLGAAFAEATKAHGPAHALPMVEALCQAGSLRDYPWLHSVRGDLLRQLGQHGVHHGINLCLGQRGLIAVQTQTNSQAFLAQDQSTG